MGHFDHVPAGKREHYNKKTNQWELVDLKETSHEDMKIILDERNAEIEELRAEIVRRDEIIKKMNAKIIDLESNTGKKSK